MSVMPVIGNTPLMELTRLKKNPKAKIFGKLEGNNPGGSVKDRPAYYMIKEAERTGDCFVASFPAMTRRGIQVASDGGKGRKDGCRRGYG